MQGILSQGQPRTSDACDGRPNAAPPDPMMCSLSPPLPISSSSLPPIPFSIQGGERGAVETSKWIEMGATPTNLLPEATGSVDLMNGPILCLPSAVVWFLSLPSWSGNSQGAAVHCGRGRQAIRLYARISKLLNRRAAWYILHIFVGQEKKSVF